MMSEISRALASRHYDRCFVLLCELGPAAPAAAFMLESGVALADLPRAAARAIVDAKAAQ